MSHFKVKSRSADVAMVVTGKIPFSNAEGQNISMYMLTDGTFSFINYLISNAL